MQSHYEDWYEIHEMTLANDKNLSHLFLQIFAKAQNLIGLQGLITGSPFWKYPVAAFRLSLQTPFLRDMRVTFEKVGPLKSVYSAVDA